MLNLQQPLLRCPSVPRLIGVPPVGSRSPGCSRSSSPRSLVVSCQSPQIRDAASSDVKDEQLECVATGDSVVCEAAFDAEDGTSTSSSSTPALDQSIWSSALTTLTMIFPFFAWGSSMPALKLVMPHVASPLLLGAIRLLPAGLILVVWAAATGRKHPTSLQAWLWIALFGLIDGAAFQVLHASWKTPTHACMHICMSHSHACRDHDMHGCMHVTHR